MEINKFTSLSDTELSKAMSKVTADDYLLRNRVVVPTKEDCFHKMATHLAEERKEASSSRMAVLHSRYASSKGTIFDKHAHPV